MIKVLFDTNIILDIALERKPFDEQAFELLSLMERQLVKAYLSSLTVVNINYVMRKDKEKALQFTEDLLQIFEITDLDKSILLNSLKSGFKDFEDAVQNFSALDSGIDIIITRNPKDYVNSELKIFEPTQFLDFINRMEQ